MKAVFSLLLLLLVQSQPAGDVSASIDGTVVRRGSSEPVAGATVELTAAVGDRLRSFSATTAADGSFRLQKLPPGRNYQMIAVKKGNDWIATAYGQRGVGARSTPIHLDPGQRLQGLQIEMIPTGGISGRVVDANGAPMQQAEVHVMAGLYWDERAGPCRSSSRLSGVLRSIAGYPTGAVGTPAAIFDMPCGFHKVYTNSRGEYQIPGLPPGQYYLGASFPGDQPSSRNGAGYIPTFYPDTTDATAATPVNLHMGDRIQGLTITLGKKVRVRKLSGVVVDAATGQPQPSAIVLLSSLYALPYPETRLQNIRGSFEISEVPPGPYLFTAVAGKGGHLVSGRMRLDVAETDIKDLRIELRSGIDIAGRILLEGGNVSRQTFDQLTMILAPDFPATPEGDLIMRSFSLAGSAAKGALPVAAPVLDGAFVFRNVLPWDYRLTASPILTGALLMSPRTPEALRNAYVKSARMGTINVLRDGLNADTPPAGTMEIAIGMDGGTLEGHAVDEKNSAMIAKILLIPAGQPRRRGDLYWTALTTSTGQFQMTGIPPGDYLAFAWEQVDEDSWLAPNYLRVFEKSGTAVHIGSNGRQSITLTAIPPWL